MADQTSPNPPVVPTPTRPGRPMSEALLNEKVRPERALLGGSKAICLKMYVALESNANHAMLQWDHCLSTALIRSTLGAGFGVIFSVLLFKRRAWPVWTGLGFGAGRAWEECDSVRSPYYIETAMSCGSIPNSRWRRASDASRKAVAIACCTLAD